MTIPQKLNASTQKKHEHQNKSSGKVLYCKRSTMLFLQTNITVGAHGYGFSTSPLTTARFATWPGFQQI
jgi:hypothetical protein